jgi:hypothetical protein
MWDSRAYAFKVRRGAGLHRLSVHEMKSVVALDLVENYGKMWLLRMPCLASRAYIGQLSSDRFKSGLLS